MPGRIGTYHRNKIPMKTTHLNGQEEQGEPGFPPHTCPTCQQLSLEELALTGMGNVQPLEAPDTMQMPYLVLTFIAPTQDPATRNFPSVLRGGVTF